MPAKEPFHPKAAAPAIERKRINGLFQNTAPYPQLGGFSSSSKIPTPNRPLSLERGKNLTRPGKPI